MSYSTEVPSSVKAAYEAGPRSPSPACEPATSGERLLNLVEERLLLISATIEQTHLNLTDRAAGLFGDKTPVAVSLANSPVSAGSQADRIAEFLRHVTDAAFALRQDAVNLTSRL